MAASQMLASAPRPRVASKPVRAIPPSTTTAPFTIIPTVGTLMTGFAVLWVGLSVLATFDPTVLSWIENLL